MRYVIGIDLGTSGVKCLLVTEKGEIAAQASRQYSPDFPESGYVEQAPDVWWNAVKDALKELISSNPAARDNIVALSTSGQMHSSVFLDKNGEVIRKAILWNDTRTMSQTKEIYEKCGGKEAVLSMVYNLALEGFTLPKILWLKENEAENYQKVYKVIMPKDYINYMLTGNIYTDVSDAAGTLAFDIKNSCWCMEILDKLEIPADIFPQVLPSTGIVGDVRQDTAAEIGLRGCRVIAGGADNSCAAVGNGVIAKGEAVISVGTSGTVIGYTDSIDSNVNGSVHLFNYSVPNSLYAMGCMLCAGQSLNWLKQTLLDPMDFDEINRLAAETKCGSDGLLFLPYLFGERSPHNNPNARGVFFGIGGSAGKGELIRAVMEGVGFALRDLYEQVAAFTQLNEIYITGGGAKSAVWGQIICDIIDRPLNVLNISEGPSFGAALIALVGSGIYESFEAAKGDAVKIARTMRPSENTKKYAQIYPVFRELYKANISMFDRLKAIR